MGFTPLSPMGTVTKIAFVDALGRLQDLLGEEVSVLVSFHGTFGGVVMRGTLTRVDTVPPDHSAIDVLLDDRQSLMLDPIDTEVLLVEDLRERRWWLEFHLPSGVMATVERPGP